MSDGVSSQAGLASFEGTELQRRRQLARMTRPELIDAVISAEGLVTSVPTEHEVGCPTCSGQIRETVGMVCQTCGTDYA